MRKLPIVQGRQEGIEEVRDSIEDMLGSCGISEVMTNSFIHPNTFVKLNLPEDDYRNKAIEIINPISDEFKVMRTTMLPSLLNTASYNFALKTAMLKIFEAGRVFIPNELPISTFPTEKRILCVVMSGKRNEIS